MRARMIVLLTTLAVAASAAAARAAFVDLDAQNGDVITSRIATGGYFDFFRVVCPAGVTLNVTAKSAKTGPSLAVALLDSDFVSVVPGSTGRSVALHAPLAAGGEYVVRVAAQDTAATGDYTVSISWSETQPAPRTLDVAALDHATVSFAAGRGDTATIAVRPARRSNAAAGLASLTTIGAVRYPARDLGGRRKATVTLARAGDHELSLARVGSSAGDVVVTINLRPAHRRLRLTGTLGPWQARVRAAARATPGADATISADSAFDLRDCGVFVPKGAVRAKTSIVLAMGDVLAITPSVAGLQPAGRPVFVGPDGLTLRRGKTLTVTMHAAAGPSEIPRVFASSADGAVTEIPSSVLVYDRGAATVAVRVDRLGTFQAFRPLQTSFRVAVAASDDVVAVGAPNETVDGHPNAGAVHVLVRDGASWTEEATIHGATPADDDRFGHAVALSGDTLVVGAPVYADPGHAFPARIRTASVFVRDADHHWTQQATLQPTASGTASGDFGISVAIDGDVVVVGSPFEQRADASYDSAAYVFDRVGGQWSVGRRLIDGPAAGPDSYTLFGSHVALSGGTLLISDSSGYASVFVRSADSWDLQQQIALPSPLGGTSVADGDISSIALDGDTAVLATTRDAIGLGGPPGAAFVFSRSGSTWSQRATLVPSNYGDQGGAIHFGESVAVHGGRILVGAPLLKAAGAFLYADSPQGPTLVSVLGANDKSPNDGLGTSVALTPSGITAVVGSPFAVVPGAAQTHAYDVP